MSGTALSLMLLELGGARFAVPLDRVIGVTETDAVTPLPFSPPGLDGLVMALGQIVPQVATGRVLGLPQAEGGVLLVVSDLDGALALRIDRVLTLIQCDAGALAGEPGSLLGAMRVTHDGDSVPVLDITRLAADPAVALAPAGQALLAADTDSEAAPEPAPDETIASYLRFDAGGDRYALPLDAAGDLVVLPGLRRMPGAPDWVAGLFDYRGEPFLALDTARLLGARSDPADAIGLLVAFGGLRVALLVSRAAGVARVADGAVRAMALPMAGIASYYVDPGGTIVGIVAVDRLLAQVGGRLAEIAPRQAAPDAAAPAADQRPTRRVLTVEVAGQMFGLPLDRVERIEPSVSLTSLPFDGGGFDGMADVGDATIPVLDLRRCLGAAASASASGACALARLDGAMAGLMVDHVVRIEDLPEVLLEPVADAALLPVSHVAAIGGRIVSVLTIDRLLPPLP
jgi:chemotaxis signal transduction protein